MDKPFMILGYSYQIELNPCFFDEASLPNIRKAVGCLFQNPLANRKTAHDLHAYLVARQAEAKEAWTEASHIYQNEYRLLQDLHNRRLLAEVKRCKAAYERWGKIINYFDNLNTVIK